MKILQIVPDLNLAGAQTMCENLVMELKKNADDIVEIISFYNDKTPITQRLELTGIKIYYLDKKSGFDFKLIKKIRKIISEFNPDVIHTHRYVLEYVIPAVFMKKKIKIIHTVHNVAEKEVSKGLQLFQKWLFKSGRVRPVAISDIVKESIERLYKIKNVPVVYNGIDLNNCIKKDTYTNSLCILHIGRFSDQKNHLGIISIFEKCYTKNKNLKLILVGDGEKKNDIENLVKNKQFKDNVIFKGNLSSCYDILNKTDIFILPSKWEGMPMTLIEAMGTGNVCVAYPVGGIPDMIDNEINGFLPENEEKFANVILKLCENEKLKSQIGKNAIVKSNRFSSNNMKNDYYSLYKDNS